MSRTRNVIIALALTTSLATSSGCNRYGLEILRGVVEIAAAVAWTALVLAAHDAHYHHAHCGHQYVVYESRPVYQYQGRWEYYDPWNETWYYYPDGLPGY
jgi:hypothetical protein